MDIINRPVTQNLLRHLARLRWLVLVVSLFLAAVVSAVWVDASGAQEAWCTANPANCVCSDTFQSTSYTARVIGGNYGAYLGDQVGSKACFWTDVVNNTASITWTFGVAGTFDSMAKISTDATILNLLPNRNPSSVARFLRFAADNDNATMRFGHTAIDLAGRGATRLALRFAADNNNSPMRFGSLQMDLTGVKRMAMRWYSYHSPNYEWQGDGLCTNGKIAHNSGPGGFGQQPLLTHSVGGNKQTFFYTFNTSLGWSWATNPSFGGFFSGSGPWFNNTPYSVVNYRGKWHRHEIVVSNPHVTDTGGYQYRYYVKNVTDNLAEVLDTSLDSGTCNGCFNIPESDQIPRNFVGDNTIHPATADMVAFHTEFTRDTGTGPCAGWQGWVYMVMATWTTDAGQRIEAASEVEGGGGMPPRAPSGLRVK